MSIVSKKAKNDPNEAFLNTTTDFLGGVTQTGEESFVAADPMIRNVSAARAMYSTLRTQHLPRIALYAEIAGLIQGNPPYNPRDLAAANLEFVSNFNDLSARSVIKRACLAYFNLLHNAQYLARFVLNLPGVPEAPNLAKIFAKNWDFVIKQHWRSFYVNVCTMTQQLVTLGVSPVVWPDERDFRWRVVELNRLYIPDQTQCDLDQMTTILVETDFTVQYLWQLYDNFKDRKKDDSPWNVDEIGKLLVYLSNTTKETTNPLDLYDLQQKRNSGDVDYANTYSDTVKVITVFQKEFDGKVSVLMFHRDYSFHDFLYRHDNQYDSLQDAIVLFTLSPGEFTVHGNKGIGHEIFSLAQAKVQADCSVVDMMKWASTPIVKSPAGNTRDGQQIRFYPGVPTDIGSMDFVQNNLGSNVQNAVQGAEYLMKLIDFNISYSGSDPASPDPDKGSLSPTQSRLQATKEFSVLKNSIMHFYYTFDRVFQNMTAKMFNSKEGYPADDIVEEFFERCIRDGVPEQLIAQLKKEDKNLFGLPKSLEVYATRVAGAGSQVAQLIALQELSAIVGSFGPREERQFKSDFVQAVLGPEYLEAYMQESDDIDENAGGASLAAVENAIMKAGQSAIFSQDNDQRAHVAVHLALGTQIVQMRQQNQMDPVEADAIFNVLVPHLNDHMNALATNMFAQEFYSKTRPAYEQLAQYAQLNRKNAIKVLQAQAKEQDRLTEAQQEAMSDQQRKDYIAQKDEQRKDFKLQAQNQRQNEQHELKQELATETTRSQIRNEERKTDAKISAERAKAALTNHASEDGAENPREAIAAINGRTIAPADIEGA